MKPICLFILFSFSLFGQDTINTQIASENNYELSIIKTFPDSFPDISVVFQAENGLGLPLWDIQKTEINVYENDIPCEVTRLSPLTKEQGAKIALVIDASTSMVDDPGLSIKELNKIHNYYNRYQRLPKWYTSPLDHAKQSAVAFLKQDNSKKDTILIVPFSHLVDKSKNFSADNQRLESIIRSIQLGGGTAFYDALYYSCQELSNFEETGAIVALTDGGDNSSQIKMDELIEFAQEKDIRIYIVGLGYVEKPILEEIAKQTKGKFYYTNSASELSDIYLSIKKQLKSVYQIDYQSTINDFKNDQPKVRFEFTNKKYQFTNNEFSYKLPQRVITHLKAKEDQRIRAENEKNALIFGGLLIVLLATGGFLVSKRIKRRPKLIDIFPNPVQDVTTITHSKSKVEGKLKLFNIQGKLLLINPIIPDTRETQIDLSGLPKGWYFGLIQTENGKSETMKIFKR